MEVSVVAGQDSEAAILLTKDLIAADLRIEVKGVVPAGAAVRIHGDGIDAVYRSLKPERIRVWVLPGKLVVDVHVTDKEQVTTEIDFSTGTQHTISVGEK